MRFLEAKDFFALAENDATFLRLIAFQESSLRKGISVSGSFDPLKTYLMLAMAQKTGKKACLLLPDELRSRELEHELLRYQRNPISFRRRELNLLDTFASSREDELARLGALSRIRKGDFDVCVLSAAAIMPKLMPLDLWESFSRTVLVGEEAGLSGLCAYLAEAGYERGMMAESPGQFSQRGDLVDLVLPEEISLSNSARTGIRISFFDDRVDAIKRFDIPTQRSVKMESEICIYPSREALIPKGGRDALAERILSEPDPGGLKARDADRIAAGYDFSVTDRYLSLIYPSPGSVWDYFTGIDCLFATYEWQTICSRMEGNLKDFSEKYRSLLLKEKVVSGCEKSLFTKEEISDQIRKVGTVYHFSQLDAEKTTPFVEQTVAIRSREPLSYRGRENMLVDLLKERESKGAQTCFMVEDPTRREKLSALLTREGIALVFAPFEIERGFEYLSAEVLFLGSSQIFASSRRAFGKRKRGIAIDLFSDLKTGDLVVHEVHGIGKYGGIANIETNSVRRDYIRIEYDRFDTLYIPMESLDQIQKYIGSQDKEPRLSRLGGQEWNRLKDRARSSIRALATDLIKLYAERMSLRGFRFSSDTVWQKEFEDSFEYEDTSDQAASTEEIKKDMESEKVMDRILCGDVGFGKTEVAFRAIFKCVMDGKQAAFLVPTTVLAQQHYENLTKRLLDFPVKVRLLSRFVSEEEIRKTRKELEQGCVEIVIGTHRILSKDVRFKDLGLLIIDEEQRFGVDHKEKLKEQYPSIDVLTLTATPIPRTLHMSLSGIRDISVLEEPPLDRMPVQTYVMHYDEGIVAEAMLREISRSGQVFYLFNHTARIGEKAREIERMLPGAKVAVGHGKMEERELENVISSFVHGEADILVCTTIIESGIDMPNVNTMIVEGADRLGLAQLHQLRGRVGRSERQAYCYITYKKEKVLSETAQKRLAAIRDYTELGSGFKIAMRDLEVRGAGNLLGAQQHGNMNAIGYDLYCRMLKEEISRQAGHKETPIRQAHVDIEIHAYIPHRYVPDEGQRMDLYRRIGQILDTQSYMDVQDEISDRYGEIPDEVITLTDISYIRGYAGMLGFERVWERKGSMILSYSEDCKPDMEVLSYILGLPRYKGQLSFHAQNRPYLVLKNAAIPIHKAPQKIRRLLSEIENGNPGNITKE